MDARSYQLEAIQNTLHAWQSGHKRVLLVMATGLGKSLVATKIAEALSVPALFLAHRQKLVDQLREHTKHLPQVMVTTIQSMVRQLESYSADAFGLLVIDEAHHSVSKQYLKVLRHFQNARILGLTATPDRADGKALRQVFSHVSYRYQTYQAIKDGWLAPITKARIHNIQKFLSVVGTRKTIIFTPSIRVAQITAKRLLDHGAVAMWVSGAMPKKISDRILEVFQQGGIQYLINANLLTEGYDLPNIQCITILRDIKSRAFYQQAIGRGLRLANGKADCLVVDLTLDGLRHGMIPARPPLDGLMKPMVKMRTKAIVVRRTKALTRIANWIRRFLGLY